MSHTFNPGKFLILGFDGFSPDERFIEFISKTTPAGFLLLGHNFRDTSQLKALVSTLKSIVGQKTLLMVDQEPGRVQRFKKDFPPSKKPGHYVKHAPISEFREWCCQTAEKLADSGIDINLAPVLDLWSFENDYPVLNERSFGANPELVIEFGLILVEEFRKFHIGVCAKHFPGLGSANGDPHQIMSTSDDKLERFLDYHWQPFKALARASIDLVMTTHLLCSALDSENCATYSGNVIGHLRNSVGFTGPVISDDLYMAGANAVETIGQAAVRSISAGHNLLIISRDLELQKQSAAAIAERYISDDNFRKISSENDRKLKSLKNVE
jgi:beta-N-acetylhexosaminidase